MKKLISALALHAAAASVLAQSPAATPPAQEAVAGAESPATPVAGVRKGKPKPKPARPVPDEIFAAELKDIYDVSFTLGEYRGRVIVLNFWASWCGPCRREIPELNRLREEYAPRGVEFVGLTTESPGAASERVRAFVGQFRMDYRVGWADPDVAAALMTRAAVPQTLVVSADGRVVERFVGYSKKTLPLLSAAIEEALEPPPEEEEPEPAADAEPAPSAPETSRPPRA